MGFAIPKLQYKNISVSAHTASANNTLTSITDTTGISAGMFVTGAGIPAGTTVLSTTSTTVVMSANATATATVTVYFGFEISFDYPPIEKEGERVKTTATTSESLSGQRQVAVSYIEGLRKLTFSFVSQTIYLQLQTFLQTHAGLGNSFRYFDDKTLSTYTDYELDKLDVAPKKIAPKGLDTYVWEVPLEIRRVIA